MAGLCGRGLPRRSRRGSNGDEDASRFFTIQFNEHKVEKSREEMDDSGGWMAMKRMLPKWTVS